MCSKVSYITIPTDYTEQRIDNFLFKNFKTVPKSHLYRAIRMGEVRVNKKRVRADSRLNPGDIVRIPPLQSSEQTTVQPQPSTSWREKIKKAVIYEDAYILALNKPAGLPVHGDQGRYGVIDVVKILYPQYPDLELAHRLDKETSGCLLLAKKRRMLKVLHAAFRQGQVKKTYFTVTHGCWKDKQSVINAPLSRREKATPECSVRVDFLQGKPAVTRFVVVKHFGQSTAVLAYPETGRTHQIRVHAQAAQHPIAGDSRYGDARFNDYWRQQGLTRLFLHALALEITLPDYPAPLKFYAPLAPELVRVLPPGVAQQVA